MVVVSVIIPIYNGEKYLEDCLDSVVNQTLQDIEIICVDDGSTDKTSSILKNYSSKDKRFRIITTENRGQGAARNTALSKSNGEYIAFIDADDWIELNALELLYSKAKSDDLDLLFFQMVNYIQKSGNFINTDLYNLQCFVNNGISDKITFNHHDTKNYLFEIPVGPVSKLYKKKFLELNDLCFPEGMFFEDNAFFYNVYFNCKKAGFLENQLYYRRRHDDSVTQTLDETKFDIIKATNSVLDIFLQNNVYESYKYDIVNHSFSMLIEWFKKSPLYLRQTFYYKIKCDFKGFHELKEDFNENLNEDYSIIYEVMLKNEQYIDFLSEYKIYHSEYVIYDMQKEFSPKEYTSFKLNNSKQYKISVIIPIYNNEKFIYRTLMSIENQTFGLEDIEVLMVDDSSTDKSYEILKQYSDMYDGFKAIHIKKGTKSPGTPRNIGLKEALGDYVIFLDHDDLFEVNALEVLYYSIIESNCDFVYGTYVSIDVDSPTKIIYPNEKQGYFENIFENPRAIAFPPPSIWTKLFKKDFLVENNILFPTILGEDAIFVSKALFRANGICYLGNQTICYHILNKNSHTKDISYNYLSEGFVSEEYMYELYKKYENENFYKIRGEGILDFYLSQFHKASLTKNEVIEIFPRLYDFVNRLFLLGLSPHVSDNNKILFNHILNNDVDSVLNFKKLNEKSSKSKIKLIFKKIINKFLR